MAFQNQSPSKPARRRPAKDPVFCVGWRAYVNWPLAAGMLPQPVPTMNRDGNSLDSDLADGQEVEILSWQPRSRGGLIYEIRRIGDGREWWIAAVHLRRTSETQQAIHLQPAPEATSR
jgi:hypothetical protein